MIEQEVRNADKIITDLLDYARVILAYREPVSVPELVQRVLARHPVPPAVKVALKLPAGLPMVYADPPQVEQVLGNLVVNACQAMNQGGKLTISARRVKEMVAIAVKDTGTGIIPENMKKSSSRSSPPRPRASGWGWRSAGNWPRPTAGGSKWRARRGRAVRLHWFCR